MSDLISRRLRSKLTDYLAGNSVLREIEAEFEAENIPYKPTEKNVGGERRTLIQGYYDQMDFTKPVDARRFLNVLAVFLGKMERIILDPSPWGNDVSRGARSTLDEFQEQLRRDGYGYNDGIIAPITAAARLADAKAIATGFDASHIHEQIRRIEASVDIDPALAIGTAKELVESCFKTILTDRRIDFERSEDILQLGKRVLKELKLVPSGVPDSAKGAASIKRVLSNLATVVQGLAEIRSLYGTGHGRDGRSKGLSPRHARLAVGAASTLVTFVFQTHLETSEAALRCAWQWQRRGMDSCDKHRNDGVEGFREVGGFWAGPHSVSGFARATSPRKRRRGTRVVPEGARLANDKRRT